MASVEKTKSFYFSDIPGQSIIRKIIILMTIVCRLLFVKTAPNVRKKSLENNFIQ